MQGEITNGAKIACTWSEVQVHLAGMRSQLLAITIAVTVFGCESNKPAGGQAAPVEKQVAARAPLADLTTASGLGAVRTAFNAHKGEARFLTLLAPT